MKDLIAWRVRDALPQDADAIATVARAAWRDAYAGLLQPATIETFLERAYGRDRLLQRIAQDRFLICEGPTGIAAFADAVQRDDRLDLLAIYARPSDRRRGAGSALLTRLASDYPGQPISADVLLGNRKGEVFYERRGFAPREILEASLFGEPVVERRWWLLPLPPSQPPPPPVSPAGWTAASRSRLGPT